jgi:hypothetical protein
MRSVSNVFVDVYEFQPIFNYENIDIILNSIYESPNSFSILVKRLDQENGWNIDINVLIWYRSENKHDIINIGTSDQSEKRILINTEFIIYPGQSAELASGYKMIEPPNPIPISKTDFNDKFNTDLVTLPAQLYAVGIANNIVYMYNEKYIMFHEIMKSINHILRTYLTYRNRDVSKKFYFIICAADGYMEYHYPSERIIPRMIGETEYQNKDIVILDSPLEYAVFGNKIKYILAQSYQSGTPNIIGIPDRHYFYCNLYHPFRSFHKGMSFNSKISKIAFVARKERGTKYNFTNRRDIEMNQREYFFSDNVSKKNVECSIYWVDSKDLVKFKYILDIDGMAATWDATAWKMNSGSVLFKTDSCWKQWFYDDFEPWKNYIPIRDDFSDIDEKFEWCESNPEECQKIIENNLNLFQKVYRYQNVVDYTLTVIDLITEKGDLTKLNKNKMSKE